MTLKPFSQVIEGIRQLAADNPSRISACENFTNGEPECIFGHFYAQCGVIVDPEDYRLMILNGNPVGGTGGSVYLTNWNVLGYRAPGKSQARWARHAQSAQDFDRVWADAVSHADKEVRLR